MSLRRLLLLATSAPIAFVACIEPAAPAPADAPLEAHRTELLDLAFDAASAFPLQPHEKSRARAQAEVVEAALNLDQPTRALGFAAGIENWREGLALADYALWAARRGATAAALEPSLARAALIADDPVRTGEQDWRRARIRVRIAESWLALGDAERAADYLQGANAAESGAIERTAALLADGEAFDRQLAAVDAVIAAGDFDAVRHALSACVALYGRFYQDAARRDLVEKKVLSVRSEVPADVSLSLRLELAEAALANADAARALTLVERAQELFESIVWNSEDRIRLRARLAALRHRCGERERARLEAEAARESYGLARDEIVDIYRAGVLVPLAECFFALGEREDALALYSEAVAESQVNPNARPRCDDLVAICCSLAVQGLEPDAALEQRLRDARAALGDPW